MIQKLSDYKSDNKYSAIFAGMTKSGKTCAAASFPKPLHIMEFDNRINGLEGAAWLSKEEITFEYFPPRTATFPTPMADRVLAYLNSLLDLYKSDPTNAKGKFPTTLILDSITAMTHGFLTDALPITHENKKDIHIGSLPVPGQRDYGYESVGTKNVLTLLRSLPIKNLIVSAHLIDVFGKEDPEDKYSATVVTGQKLSIRDKIAQDVGIYFNDQLEFTRETKMGRPKFFVQFYSGYAASSRPLPTGKQEITGIDFYDFYQKKLVENKKAA